MKLLAVIPYVPTLIRVRPYNLLLALARMGHTITLATLTSGNSEEAGALRVLESHGIRILAEPLTRARSLLNCALTLPTGKPLQAVYCESPGLHRRIDNLLARETFDAAHVEHLRGSGYALALRERVRVVWDSVDCITALFEKAVARNALSFGKLARAFDLPRTRRYEAWLARQFPHTVVTSPRDAEAFRELAGIEVDVIANGVDLDYFDPLPEEDRHPSAVVFSGKMSYHANAAAARRLIADIMPLAWAVRPDAEAWIVGKDPGADLRAYAGDPRVTVTDTVPDMRTWIGRAAVAAAPLVYSMGIQNKVLEAMAMKTPVVASPNAAAALDVTPGEHLLIGVDDAEIAAHIIALLENSGRRRELAESGRAYVEAHHSWDQAAARFTALYEKSS